MPSDPTVPTEPVPTRYLRKVIRIRAEDSPNVRLALEQRRLGMEPTGEVLLPGVLPYNDYVKRRATWDAVRQQISLDAWFWEGPNVLMYPPSWLDWAEHVARDLDMEASFRKLPRRAKAIGVDTGEGTSSTVMAAVDEFGILEIDAVLTPDTSVIVGNLLAFMRRHQVEAHQVVFDRGGGGQHRADDLRRMGHRVRTVSFSEPVMTEPGKEKLTSRLKKVTIRESKYAYKNRRAQMYGELREMINPDGDYVPDPANPRFKGFGLPSSYTKLREQLAVIPILYDQEGRIELPPKNKRNPQDTRPSLTSLIGYSPDEADAVVMAIYAMTHRAAPAYVGAWGW
jgi:hypothetical protein